MGIPSKNWIVYRHDIYIYITIDKLYRCAVYHDVPNPQKSSTSTGVLETGL